MDLNQQKRKLRPESTGAKRHTLFADIVDNSANQPKSQRPEDVSGFSCIDRVVDTSDAKTQRRSVKGAPPGPYHGSSRNRHPVIKKGETPPESEYIIVSPREDKDPPQASPSARLLPPEPANSWAVTEFTGCPSTQKINYLAS